MALSSNAEFQRALGFVMTLREAHQLAIADLKIYAQQALGTTDIPSIAELYGLWQGNTDQNHD